METGETEIVSTFYGTSSHFGAAVSMIRYHVHSCLENERKTYHSFDPMVLAIIRGERVARDFAHRI